MNAQLRLQELMTKYFLILIRIILGTFIFKLYWWVFLQGIFDLQPITLLQSLVCVLGFRLIRRL